MNIINAITFVSVCLALRDRQRRVAMQLTGRLMLIRRKRYRYLRRKNQIRPGRGVAVLGSKAPYGHRHYTNRYENTLEDSN